MLGRKRRTTVKGWVKKLRKSGRKGSKNGLTASRTLVTSSGEGENIFKKAKKYQTGVLDFFCVL